MNQALTTKVTHNGSRIYVKHGDKFEYVPLSGDTLELQHEHAARYLLDKLLPRDMYVLYSGYLTDDMLEVVHILVPTLVPEPRIIEVTPVIDQVIAETLDMIESVDLPTLHTEYTETSAGTREPVLSSVVHEDMWSDESSI